MFSGWKTATAGVVVSLASVLVPAVATTAHAAPEGCPSLYVVAIPGTWETSKAEPGRGMLALAADDLPGNAQTDYVAYTATAFPWEGEVYGRSKNEAVAGARGLIGDVARRCGNTRFALLGYSQGADAAGDLAVEIGTGLGVVPADRVGLVGLIADPRRSPSTTSSAHRFPAPEQAAPVWPASAG